MASRSRLSREEKGKDIATPSSPARDANGNPLDEFELIHRDALRDTANMSLSQRLLVADAHRQFRKEEEGRIEGEERVGDEEHVGDEDGNASGSGSEAPRSVVKPRRRARRGVRSDRTERHPVVRSIPYDQIDCRPVIYHPVGIFEELPRLPPDVLRDL